MGKINGVGISTFKKYALKKARNNFCIFQRVDGALFFTERKKNGL